jgi:hypothetical protein
MKAVYVVRINNYFPELCEITIPLIKNYAKKIGAEFVEITERKFPDFPPTYEKLQIYELGKNNDWNILSDADNLIHPNAVDLTAYLKPDHVGYFSGFDANNMFEMDKYFERDGRNLGMATGWVMSSNLTHDLWTPLEFGWEEARKRTKREFIIDEYCLSRNLAKFGLKFTGLNFSKAIWDQFPHLGVEEEPDRKAIVEKAKNIVKEWKI